MVNVWLPENVCDSQVIVGKFPRLKASFTLRQLKKTMDKFKIESALVFASAGNSEKQTRKILRASMKDPRLFVLLRASVKHYLLPSYVAHMEKLIQNHPQIVGVKINGSSEKHRPTDVHYKQVMHMLNDNNALLVLHCGRWVQMSGWQYAVQIAKKYSHIKVVFAHMGGTHPDLAYPAIEAAKHLQNVYMNTAQNRQVQVLEKGVEALGSDRILFGSDMPWGDYAQNLVGITQGNLTETQMNKILRENFFTVIGKT